MKLPSHLFISSCDGALHDTRKPNWSATPLRTNYSRHHREINSVADLKATLRASAVTFPGCYPLYFVTSNGCALSFETVLKEFRLVADSIRTESNDGWRVIGCDVNYEDGELYCEHSGKKIEAAYV